MLPYPEGWSMCVGLEEPDQALIPALPGWSTPCSEENDQAALLSFGPWGMEGCEGGSSEKACVKGVFKVTT